MPPSKNKSPYGYEPKNIWEESSKEQIAEIFAAAELYKSFSNEVRTERQAVSWVQNYAQNNGFKALETFSELKSGDKVFFSYENKNIFLAIIGNESIKNGVNIIGAHLDAPRLDLKVRPLIEEFGIAMLKTHYYGGIKKYQWLNIPLAIHGTVIRGDGTSIEISIGDKENDPIFVISDLLPHLSRKIQGEKKLLDGIEAENLNLFVGSMPIQNEDFTEKVKAWILQELYQQYRIVEEDLISAELEVVPAFPTKDLGLDRSMIAGYAHDDRVCSFAAIEALAQIQDVPSRTSIVYLTDKEEIGSVGITGTASPALPLFIGEIFLRQQINYSDLDLRRAFKDSYCLSADVGALLNPMYATVHDKYNASFLNCGIIIKKYTGSGGKYAGSDASAELVAKIRKIFNDNGVLWQASSMGKVDEGGGGTIAHLIARFGIPVIDCGIGVIGMHSPYEIISKADLFQMIKGYRAFFENA